MINKRLAWAILLGLVLFLCILKKDQLLYIFTTIVISGFLSCTLSPFYNYLVKKGLKKYFSAFLSVGLITLVIFTALGFFVFPLISSTKSFINKIPSYLLAVDNRFPIMKLIDYFGIQEYMKEYSNETILNYLNLPNFYIFLNNLLKTSITFVLIPLFTFFMLKDKDELFKILLCIIPNKQRFISVLKEISLGINTYIYGCIFTSLICSLLSMIIFRIFNIDQWLFFSLSIGICSFVPFVGVLIGGIPALMISLTSSWTFWFVCTTLIVIQYICISFLTPKTVSNSINIHAVFSIFIMFLGYGIFGILGLFFAVPVFVFAKVCVKYIFFDFFNNRDCTRQNTTI